MGECSPIPFECSLLFLNKLLISLFIVKATRFYEILAILIESVFREIII